MYSKVAVIGLGTLGGFLCKHISEIEEVRELVIIDHDMVEGRNVFKSIYTASQVGEYKVDALAELLKDDVTVTKINRRYIEGKTSLPLCDLIIDCRDVVCDRAGEIDVRLYITGRILIIDCRNQVKNVCSYDGSYSIQLNKNEIKKAAFYASEIIYSDQIRTMINNRMIQRVDLDILPSVMNKAIVRTLEDKVDIVHDDPKISRRLQCMEDNIKPILELNKTNRIDVYVGERPKPTFLQKLFSSAPDVAETKYALIPAKSMNTSTDVMHRLSEIVKRQPGVSNYIVTIRRDHGQTFVELLEETGAA